MEATTKMLASPAADGRPKPCMTQVSDQLYAKAVHKCLVHCGSAELHLSFAQGKAAACQAVAQRVVQAHQQ